MGKNRKEINTLHPSFAPPAKWRDPSERGKTLPESMKTRIRERDDHTCAYCGYRSFKFQIVDHIDGNPENNTDSNLQTVCQMCNLIKHAGQGCVIKKLVDLYAESDYSQVDIIRITRQMRDDGYDDAAIIDKLGLKDRKPFKMDREYLKPLYGFVKAGRTDSGNDMYDRWLQYHKKHIAINSDQMKANAVKLTEFSD